MPVFMDRNHCIQSLFKKCKKSMFFGRAKNSFFVMPQVPPFSAIAIRNPGAPANPFLRHENINSDQ